MWSCRVLSWNWYNLFIKAHKENAPECLNMVHYPELAETKGVVLMVGEYDKDVLVSLPSLSDVSCIWSDPTFGMWIISD